MNWCAKLAPRILTLVGNLLKNSTKKAWSRVGKQNYLLQRPYYGCWGQGCRARRLRGAEPSLLMPKNGKFLLLLLFFACPG